MTNSHQQHFAAEKNRRIRLPPLRSSTGGGPVADIGQEAYIGGPFSPTYDRRREAMVLRANAEFHHHLPFGLAPATASAKETSTGGRRLFHWWGDVVVQPKRRRLEFDYDDRQQPSAAAGEREVVPMSAQWAPRDVSPTRSSTHPSSLFFGTIPTDDRSASSAMYPPPAHQQHQLRKSLVQQPFSSSSSRTSTPASLTAVSVNKQQQMTASTDRSGS